jgi:hypothetical protein
MASKNRRQNRFLKDLRYINRQVKIARVCGFSDEDLDQPHRFHKKAALDCGNARCGLCSSTRKLYGHKTMQETKFEMFCEVAE